MVTDGMLKSGSEALWCRLDLNGHTLDGVKRAAADCYTAMYAARPTADLGEDGEPDAESIARLFHETYERLAPQFSYETRKASAVPWEQVPENNRKLMIAVASEVSAVLSRSGG